MPPPPIPLRAPRVARRRGFPLPGSPRGPGRGALRVPRGRRRDEDGGVLHLHAPDLGLFPPPFAEAHREGDGSGEPPPGETRL